MIFLVLLKMLEVLVQFCNKIPVPGLKTYAAVSILLISYSTMNAVSQVRTLNETLSIVDVINRFQSQNQSFLSDDLRQTVDVWSKSFFAQIVLFMVNDSLGIWVIFNKTYDIISINTRILKHL